MKKILLALGLGMFSLGMAQRICGTTHKMETFYQGNLEARKNKENLYNFLKTRKKEGRSIASGIVTIPIVVHVLYKNDAQNISDAQILSQIKVLNEDFRKLNADFASNVPDAFKPVAADMELAFCLATKDPNGSTTTGIIRKSVPSNFNFNDDYYDNKANGSASWDTNRYLNIWVGDITDDYLGWAYMPDAVGYSDDGLAIGYKYFGTMGTAEAPYNLGRTATHEIGHYFGLHHIWGNAENTSTNGSNNCGKADYTDYCDDTPATFHEYYENPTYPNFNYVCDKTSPDGAMFMNYMDYVFDGVMGLFTNDQKTIVRNAIDGPRNQLINTNACVALSVMDLENFDAIAVYPNPTSDYISIKSPKEQIDEVEIFGTDGRVVKKVNLKNSSEKIDVKSFPSGIYYLRTYGNGSFVKSLKFIKK